MTKKRQALSKDWLISHHHAKEGIRIQMINDLPLKDSSYVLDAGCGTGNFADIFLQRTKLIDKILCVDKDIDNLEAARKILQGKKNFEKVFWLHDEIENLTFIKEFDIVWCANTLQYFDDPVSMIQKLMSMTKKGGLVAIKDEDVMRDIMLSWDPEFELAMLNAWYKIATNIEGDFWDPFIGRKLLGLMQKSGLKDINIKNYLVEYSYPLPESAVSYIHNAFVNYSKEYKDLLSDKNWRIFSQTFDLTSSDYLFNREDFHFVGIETLVTAVVSD